MAIGKLCRTSVVSRIKLRAINNPGILISFSLFYTGINTRGMFCCRLVFIYIKTADKLFKR